MGEIKLDNDLKVFIEKNIVFIEYSEFDYLYDEAYEWLSNDQVRSLTQMLSNILDIDLKKFAIDNILKHFSIEIENFKHVNEHKSLFISSFERLYMNHLNGLSIYDFENLAQQYLIQNNLLPKSKFVDGELLLIK